MSAETDQSCELFALRYIPDSGACWREMLTLSFTLWYATKHQLFGRKRSTCLLYSSLPSDKSTLAFIFMLHDFSLVAYGFSCLYYEMFPSKGLWMKQIKIWVNFQPSQLHPYFVTKSYDLLSIFTKDRSDPTVFILFLMVQFLLLKKLFYYFII